MVTFSTGGAGEGIGRRALLKGGGAVGAAAALQGLMGHTAQAARRGRGDDGMQAPDNGGYGPLQPAPQNLELLLPAGFSYVAFGETGTLMSNGMPTPGKHDGMATFPVHEAVAIDPATGIVYETEDRGSEARGTAPGRSSSTPPAAGMPVSARSGSTVRVGTPADN